MTGLFNLRTRLALCVALLVVVALGSVYFLAQRLGTDLNSSGFAQDLNSIENRVSGSWQRESDALKGVLFSAVYDNANAAQLRAGGVQDLLQRMTLTLGLSQAWVLDADEKLVASSGADAELAVTEDSLYLARKAQSSGNAEGVVVFGDKAVLAAAARLNDGPRGLTLLVGRAVDQAMARKMTELTGARMAFFKFKAGTRATMLGAEVDQALLSDITDVVREVAAKGAQTSRDLALGDLQFRLKLMQQSDQGNVYAAIVPAVRPIADKIESFVKAVGMIAAVALALALAGGLMFGQRLTRALDELTKSARQISNGSYDIELQARSSDEMGRFVESFRHLAQSLKQREAKMFQAAHRDTVTGLPSRALFENEIVDAVTKARNRGDSLGLITIVVDRLREVNDSLGRKASDAMLSDIGDRVRRALKASASEIGTGDWRPFVARLATYEFGVILPDCDEEKTNLIAKKLADVLARRVEFESQSVLPGGRIGVAIFPDHGMDPASLLYSADIAATHAQTQLTNIAIFDPSFEEAREKQLAMLGELREALEHGELSVAMQPKISLQKQGSLMAEALMRWEHPERGPQNPAEFVPFAEKTGFITQLTNWIIDAALAMAAEYSQKGVPLGVSVNLSPRDLGSPDFTTYVVERLRAHKLRGSILTLEVTEQAVVNASPIVRQNMDVLWRLGVKIAIDDFGSGFASIEQLRALPLSYLKIDRQYVSGLVTDEASRIVVKASIELGHAIGVEVVAEGVETTEQLEALRTLNCDQAQGYFVGKPLAHDDFEAWVQTRAATFDVGGSPRGGRRSAGKAALAAAAAAAAASGGATAAASAAGPATAAAPAPARLEPTAPGRAAVAAPSAPEPAADADADGLDFEFELPALDAEPGARESAESAPAPDKPAASAASGTLELMPEATDGEMPPLSFETPEAESKA